MSKPDDLPRKMHEWYLEATRELNPESYNPNAQKTYDELTDEQKFIDRYIAEKVEALIAKREVEARIDEVTLKSVMEILDERLAELKEQKSE